MAINVSEDHLEWARQRVQRLGLAFHQSGSVNDIFGNNLGNAWQMAELQAVYNELSNTSPEHEVALLHQFALTLAIYMYGAEELGERPAEEMLNEVITKIREKTNPPAE